jgi:hypothetical protein
MCGTVSRPSIRVAARLPRARSLDAAASRRFRGTPCRSIAAAQPSNRAWANKRRRPPPLQSPKIVRAAPKLVHRLFTRRPSCESGVFPRMWRAVAAIGHGRHDGPRSSVPAKDLEAVGLPTKFEGHDIALHAELRDGGDVRFGEGGAGKGGPRVPQWRWDCLRAWGARGKRHAGRRSRGSAVSGMPRLGGALEV